MIYPWHGLLSEAAKYLQNRYLLKSQLLSMYVWESRNGKGGKELSAHASGRMSGRNVIAEDLRGTVYALSPLFGEVDLPSTLYDFLSSSEDDSSIQF